MHTSIVTKAPQKEEEEENKEEGNPQTTESAPFGLHFAPNRTDPRIYTYSSRCVRRSQRWTFAARISDPSGQSSESG